MRSQCFKLLPKFSIRLAVPKMSEGIIVIVGSNGSGKSTLLRLLSNKYNTNAPSIRNIINHSNLFFEPTNLSKDEPLIKNIDLIQSFCPLDDKFIKLSIDSLNLRSRLGEKVKNCSTGEVKKLLIALNLSQNSHPVYFLDEPFENLDARSRKWMADILEKKFIKDRGRTLFVTAHKTSELDSIKSKVIDLDHVE